MDILDISVLFLITIFYLIFMMMCAIVFALNPIFGILLMMWLMILSVVCD